MKPSLLILFLVSGLVSFSGYGQNLEQIGVKKGVKINGSLNVNTVGYYVSGIEQRRDPFNWFLTGNLNVNLFGYDAPFSFSYSNANRNFSQPFNQFSFSPTYKWIKTYIGYNAMTFSNYTLSGHVFLGGGVELTPGKWRIAAMYGRLRKAVPFDTSDSLQINNGSFKRMGYGLKIGYENNGDAISANIFTAEDEIGSIPYVLPESNLTPMQNVAMSITARKRFLQRFFIEGEYAISSLNKDVRINKNNSESDTAAFMPTNNIINGLLPENATNRYYDAMNASLGYQGNWYTLQFKYERIAPEYQTLGTYFFNNDMRNITVMPSVRLLKNTLNLSGNAGFQQNNLDNERASTTKRAVGAVNVNYVPNELWNFGLSYSNFSTYTNVKPRHDPFFQNNLDTLNFYQLSQTMNGTILRSLGKQDKPQSIMLGVSYQQANDRASNTGESQPSNFITVNAAYTYSIVPTNTTLSVAGNVYANNAAGIKTTYWGPTVSLTKAFREKTLRASLASSYNETAGSSVAASPVLNNRINLNISPRPKEVGARNQHSFAFGLNLVNRLKSTEQQPAYAEVTGTVNYTYTF